MAPQPEMQLSRLRRGLSTVELVYTSHERWPMPRFPFSDRKLNISVLDSSFNPPTLAHLALANTPFSARFKSSPSDNEDFHAKLLLLSVRNVDKLLKSGDATHTQRLDMMLSFANDIAFPPRSTQSEDSTQIPVGSNIAVGLINEPTFVGKSSTLLEFLHARIQSFFQLGATEIPILPNHIPQPKLTFLVGMDTLERLLAPRYYASEEAMKQSLGAFFSSEGDDSRIICGRRITPGLQESETEREIRTVAACKDYIDCSRIVLVDIDEEVRSLSSSDVRQKISGEDHTWTSMVTPSVVSYIVEHGLYRNVT